FLRSTVLTTSAVLMSSGLRGKAMAAALLPFNNGTAERKLKSRPDLLDKNSPKGLEIFQLTTEADVPACHLYMEAQIFTPDSKRFLLHRSATAHGGDPKDSKHQYLVCDIENDCELHQLTHEI